MLKFLALHMFLLCAAVVVNAQPIQKKVYQSPIGMLTYHNDSLYLKITYGRPKCKDRELLFGYKVPHGKIWKTGDDHATEMMLTDTMYIDSVQLLPGTYTLFSIPYEDEWDLIISTQQDLWGLYKYDPKYDLARIRLPEYRAPKLFEYLTMYTEKAKGGIDIVIIWQHKTMRMPLRTSLPAG